MDARPRACIATWRTRSPRPTRARRSSCRAFLRFGSWVGGDRDGHPHVTAAVTEHTLRLHRETALALLERDVHALQQDLSLRADEVPPPLAAALAAEARAVPGLAARVVNAFPNEPYRQLTALMLARLRAARHANAAALRRLPSYETEGALTDEVWGEGPPAGAGERGDRLPHAGRAGRDARVARPRARAPGRAPAGAGRAARPGLARARLRLPAGPARPAPAQPRAGGGARRAAGEERRCVRLPGARGARRARPCCRACWPHPAPPAWTRDGCSPEAAEVLDLFARVGRLQAELGPRAFGVFIVSMTAGVSDVLAPLLFARHAGLFDPGPRRRRGALGPRGGAAVRDHRRPARLRGPDARALRPARLPAPAGGLGRPPADHARLLGQQQGRRLPHRELGAVPRAGSARRRLPARRTSP